MALYYQPNTYVIYSYPFIGTEWVIDRKFLDELKPVEEKKVEVPKAEEKKEEPKKEEPKKEEKKPEPKKEVPKPAPKKEEPKAEPKKEAPKPAPKKEEPKKEEKKPEPKKEEPKVEDLLKGAETVFDMDVKCLGFPDPEFPLLAVFHPLI